MPRQIDIRYSRAKNNYYTDIQTTNMLPAQRRGLRVVHVGGVRARVKIHCDRLQLPAQAHRPQAPRHPGA